MLQKYSTDFGVRMFCFYAHAVISCRCIGSKFNELRTVDVVKPSKCSEDLYGVST